MSIKSDAFVIRVQDNRGKIKSQKHIDMLHAIYKVGSDETINQAENKKILGISFIHTIAIELSIAEQKLFWAEFMKLPVKNITHARLLLTKYL